jgi:hypothetical protein
MAVATHPYGWRDFDPEVVEGLTENDSRFINRRAGGWIACPLLGHFGEELPWQEDNYRKGSVLHGSPAASFRALPTYVLENPLDNIIAGRELIAGTGAGSRRRAEVARLGNENSDGALTWNVLRSLQEAGSLGFATRVLADVEATAEPELVFWEQHVELERTKPSGALLAVRDELEQGLTQHNGPDACLHAPAWGWLLIDVTFGGSSETLDDPQLVEAWLERYSEPCPGLFDDEAIRRSRPRDFPHELLTTIAFARRLKAEGEQATVVALSRKSERAGVEKWVGRCLAETADVAFRRVTWETLYRALDPDEPKLAPLRRYLENKSYGLRPAFALHEEEADEAG